MRIEPKTDQASIVLLGAFNPKIFHPSWLALKKLISLEAADSADVKIVLGEISEFTAAYMTFQIQPNRFLVKCEAIYKDVIKDLVLSTFQEHLPESQVWQMGINRKIAFSCGSENIRDQLGEALAPKDPWGPWGKDIARSIKHDGSHGGMMNVTMRQLPRPDKVDGHIQAAVAPTSNDPSAVDIDINNHFKFREPNDTIGSADAMEALSNQWLDAMNFAEYIADGLMKTVEEL